MPRNKDIRVKDKSLNVKFPDDDYKKLQEIADDIGVTLSAMVRMLIYTQLNKVRETGEASDFVMLSDKSIPKVKDRVLNVKLPENDYKELQNIADSVGLTLSAMIRTLIYTQHDKVIKSGDSKRFLDTKK